MKKIFTILILVLFLLPLVKADGMIIDPVGYVPEGQQLAAIKYQNGREDLILTIETEKLRSEKTVWIFPVKADPDKTVIDVVDQFPMFYGSEVKGQAKSAINGVISGTRAFLILPFFFFRFSGTMFRATTSSEMLSDIQVGSGEVIVYEHIEKHGVTTELLGAENGLELHVYLANKGLDLPFRNIPVLNDYLGEGYTFVVSWVTQNDQDQIYDSYGRPYYGRRIGVYVSFPTDKIYYPMKPTSVYGSEEVPATIYITGFVEPELYADIENYVTVNYYKTNRYGYSQPAALEKFYSGLPSDALEYTRIDIGAPSKLMTQDLYFKEGAPSDVKYASAMVDFFKHSGWMLWLFAALLSMLTGAILGYFWFRRPGRFALVGLANALTIIGLIIAVIFAKTKIIDPVLKKKIKQAGLVTMTGDRRKVWFVITFIVLYLVLGAILGWILLAPL